MGFPEKVLKNGDLIKVDMCIDLKAESPILAGVMS